jgi:3-hydroxyanthranilate 3,4-dioxygenase
VQYYAAACARFSADEAARTCGKCGTVAAALDLAAFGWPPAAAAQS